MKKLSVFIAGLFFLTAMAPQAAGAQEQNPDFFVGEWNATIFGTPDGDVSFVISFARNEEEALGGQVLWDGVPFADLYGVTEKESSVTALLSIGGFDIDMFFEKKEDDNFEGLAAGMLLIKGERREKEDCGC
jgi:hypothetical protein